ncbi:uncharacterized protein LOC132760262 [Ruditapes philippinarum]|uniref:uncharacterized protein LOC132760262 n=1 Tax=Ruditapes philippinarum TaxID=129788 RepID=UPI00295C0A90|nr:uncharacterized protein LOC132760262 [Ruditapes philippinarum]
MWTQIIGSFTIISLLQGRLTSSSCIIDTVQNATCDFETGPCEYQLSKPWVLVSTYTDMLFKSIPSAHGGGKTFVVFNSSSADNGNASSSIIDKGEYCLSFWHFFTGSIVHLISETSSGNKLADIQNGKRSWKQFSATIKELNSFKVIFRIIKGNGLFDKFETVGIDDIVLGVGPCTPANTSTSSFDPKSNSSEMYLKERWHIKNGTFQFHAVSISPRTGSSTGKNLVDILFFSVL